MRARGPRHAWPDAVVGVVAAALIGCGGGVSGRGDEGAWDVPLPDVEAAPDQDLPMDLSALDVACSNCHDLGALTRGEPDAGTREWMVRRGLGLVRVDPALPIAPPERRLFFVRRGRHDSQDPSGCVACHPVREDGVGHGVRSYPSVETVFDGGTGCAGSCHSWLSGPVESRGFLDATGNRPTWKGSQRPDDLLAAGDHGHSRLWREGARPDPASFRISAFNAGCGGCHNLREESHGAMLGCLDCHRLSGDLHERHIQVVASTMATLDVEAVQEGLSPCSYCHVEDDPGMGRSGAACYNCHLSGHQPMDAAGRALFWPVP